MNIIIGGLGILEADYINRSSLWVLIFRTDFISTVSCLPTATSHLPSISPNIPENARMKREYNAKDAIFLTEQSTKCGEIHTTSMPFADGKLNTIVGTDALFAISLHHTLSS